jgi:hypothetical protein
LITGNFLKGSDREHGHVYRVQGHFLKIQGPRKLLKLKKTMDHDQGHATNPADAKPGVAPFPAPNSAPSGGDALALHTDLLGNPQIPRGASRSAVLEALAARAALYATRARGEGTRCVYRTAWRGYVAWCLSLGREPLAGDPDLIPMYATKRADHNVAISTIRVDLAAIRTAHLLADIALDMRHPRLAMVVEGITRGRGTRPTRQAALAVPDVLRLLLAACPPPDTAQGAPDRAMLLLGFSAALRRSELVALQLGDVETVPDRGLRLLGTALKPTSTARARTSPTGPIPPSHCSARSPPYKPGASIKTAPVISIGSLRIAPGASDPCFAL